MKLLKWLKQIWFGKWIARRCGWPYASGWATYHTGRKMILDTGLDHETALEICAELNVSHP